jgi:hypothetical protein
VEVAHRRRFPGQTALAVEETIGDREIVRVP